MPQNHADINLAVAERDLKYYIFDWDDNILHMPTHIHLEKRMPDGSWTPHAVSTAVFSVIRSDRENYRPPDGIWENAFRDFRDIDVNNENVFLRDTRTAIDAVVSGKVKEGPSFATFRQSLIEGRLFAIVTARGHHSSVIRQAVDYFIRKVLADTERQMMIKNLRGYMACFAPEVSAPDETDVIEFYHAHNRYHGVMSPEFRARMGQEPGASPNTEEGKQFAIKDFVEHVIRIAHERGLSKPISVGFSDDDEGNVVAVENYIRNALAREFPGVKFVVYYTTDPDVTDGKKVVVHGQLSLDL
ncbi:MAG: hypothetical protein ACNA71_05415 [Kiritimatiellia bacterium]